jgi:hypothetical protein
MAFTAKPTFLGYRQKQSKTGSSSFCRKLPSSRHQRKKPKTNDHLVYLFIYIMPRMKRTSSAATHRPLLIWTSLQLKFFDFAATNKSYQQLDRVQHFWLVFAMHQDQQRI